MPRRIPNSRRPALESLEIRCNLSSIGSFAEPTPVEQQAFANGAAYAMVIDPRPSAVEERQRDADTDSSRSNSNGYFTNDYSLTVGHPADANLNTFAGQTVNIVIDAADASTASQSVGGDRQNELVGGDGGRDTLERATHELGHVQGLWHKHTRPTSDSPAVGDVNDNGRDDLTAGAAAGPTHVKVLDGTVKRELGSFFAFEGFTGGVSVATGDVNDDGVDDIITGAGVSGHVKVLDGNSGAEIRSFLAFPGFTGDVNLASRYSNVSGRITAVDADPSDSLDGVYSHPDLYRNVCLNQSELESVIDHLARDVAMNSDASQTSQAVELGNDWLAGGTGQDQQQRGAPSGKLYVATDVGVFVEAVSRDVRLGLGGEDLLIGGSTQHAQIGAGLDILIANTGGDWLDTTVEVHGRLLIGTKGGFGNEQPQAN